MDASPFVPDTGGLKALREAAAECRGCPLHGPATQTVFGEGPRRAPLMLVGEMPGDREDLAGHVFVGPAGRERGKRRIHDTPKKSEVDACLPWLRAELRLVDPSVLVVLGATTATALLGSSFRLTRSRGEPVESDLAPYVTATIHPAAILRAPDSAARQAEREAFTRDLAAVASVLSG